MVADYAILTTVLKTFLDEWIQGYGRIHDSAVHLLRLLALIDLALAAVFALLSRDESGFAWLPARILKYGFWSFLVANWITLAPAVINGFIWIGLRAGGSTVTVAEFTNPSVIAGLGFTATEPIWTHIRNYGVWAALHMVDITVCGVLGLGIILSYFIISLEILVFFLGFYLMAVLGVILVPFGVNRYTSWIADGIFGSMVNHGIKVMVLAMMTSTIFPLIHRFTLPPDPTWPMLLATLLAVGGLALMGWLAPKYAVSIFTHGPSLTAGVFTASTVGGLWIAGNVGAVAHNAFRQAAATIPTRSPAPPVQAKPQTP